MRRGCAVTVAVVAFVVGSVLWYFNSLAGAAHVRYQQELTATRAAGIATTPADLVLPEPQAGTNAAPLWVQLTEMHRQRRVSEQDMMSLDSGRRGPGPSPTVAEIRAAMQRRADLVGLVHTALERPHCVFHREWAKGPALLLPEFAYMRFAARFCSMEGQLLCQEGKPIEGVRRVGTAFRIARQLEEEPAAIIGYLAGSATNAIAFKGMADILHAAGTQPGVAQAARAEIEREWRPRAMRRGLEAEVVISLAGMDMLRSTGGLRPPSSLFGSSGRRWSAPAIVLEGGWRPPYWNAFVDGDAALVLSNLRAMTTESDRPYPHARAAMQAIDRVAGQPVVAKRSAVVGSLLPLYTGLPTRAAEDRALAAVLLSAASVLEWKVRHGAFPVTLAQAMPRVPQDPFDLRPIRYRREGNGFVVWSVGVSGRFGGGRRGTRYPSSEVLFRYPVPALPRGTP